MTTSDSTRPWYILPVIVLSQFAGTSLWFAGNAVIGDLQQDLGLAAGAVANLTSAVQFGFITGTLIFAFFAISDRYSPRWIFVLSSIAGASFTALIPTLAQGMSSLLVLRFLTGFMLAGIYPVGMKIAAGWYRRSLGNALGYLVGALVLGTAFPHLLKALGADLPWRAILYLVAAVAASGGVIMGVLVPNGPYLAQGQKFDPLCVIRLFKIRNFRSAALGYFGHMWELYTFWAFVPFLITRTSAVSVMHPSLLAFVVIAAGTLGCILGGYVSGHWGSHRVAFFQLFVSGLCCLISPLLFGAGAVWVLIILILWGVTVVGDSPQFSTLVAQAAPSHLVGSGLTIVNSIGFAITIFSIQLLGWVTAHLESEYVFLLLFLGPLVGLLSMRPIPGDSDGMDQKEVANC